MTIDTMPVENELNKVLSWQEISSEGDVLPLNFEKWLTIMNHIKENGWSRPTAEMLKELDLKVIYESDSIDECGIKDVSYTYGRQTKCVTDSTGSQFYTFDGDHSILFKVYAYTSSRAEIYFHNPEDLKNFMEQAICRGIAESSNGRYAICDKPMGKGIHKISKVYDITEKQQGAYKELYYIHPVYEPGANWHTIYVTLDFLRHSIDIEKQ